MRRIAFHLAVSLALAIGCSGRNGDPSDVAGVDQVAPTPTAVPPVETGTEVEHLQVSVVARYPHDPAAFTQGLLYADGQLYESTGLEGSSSVRRVELETGTVLDRVDLDPSHFGEGLALVGDELIQLTWTSQVALVYDRDDLEPQGRRPYAGEGWGLCSDGADLVQSDGTSRLTRRDPATFAERGTVEVSEGGRLVSSLNELECVDGAIYANVWRTSDIVRIDSATGRVTARIDASSIVPSGTASADDVLNGIAHDPADGTFLLTGKRWADLYRVRFVP